MRPRHWTRTAGTALRAGAAACLMAMAAAAAPAPDVEQSQQGARLGLGAAEIAGELFTLDGQCDLPGIGRDVMLMGTAAVVALNLDGVCHLNLGPDGDPTVTLLRSDSRPLRFARAESTVFQVEPHHGVSAWDYAIPALPRRLAFLPSAALGEGARPTGLTLRDGRLYVACGPTGMAVLATGDPTTLTLVGRFKTGIDYTKDVELLGDVALLSDNLNGGVRAIRLNQALEQEWRAVAPHCFFDDITLVGHVAYATARIQVTLIDARPDRRQRLLGALWREDEGLVSATILVGPRLLLVLREEAGVDAYDVADPRAPRYLGNSPLAAAVTAMAWDGRRFWATTRDRRAIALSPSAALRHYLP